MIAETLALLVDAEVLARIGGPLGDAARTRQRQIAHAGDAGSRATRAAWLAAARTPLPPTLRGVDGSWLEDAIARMAGGAQGALAARVRQVIAGGPASSRDVWLARWACATLPALPPIDARIARPRSMAEACAMAPAALRAWLEEIGADQIAFAIGKAASAASTRLGAAALRIAQAPRAGELGDRRAAIERARITLEEGALARVGARAIAPYASALEQLQLAHRLPRSARVLEELWAFAGSAGPPTWRALAAP